MSYKTIRSKLSIKISVKYRTFFDSYIWNFYSDLKHDSYKEKNNLLLFLKHIKGQMSYGTEKRHNNSKLNFLVVFLWMYKRYIQEKIPWIGTKHYFRIEMTLFAITFFEWLQKKCKLVECCMGHIVQDTMSVRNSLILLHKTNIKSKIIFERWTAYGHLSSSYKGEIWLQLKHTCFRE